MQPISRPTPHAPIPPYLGNEFFRRISDASKQQIADATAHLLPTSQQIQELKSRDYSLPVFQESDWLYLAIKAYGNGQIEEHILAHLFLYDTCNRWDYFRYFTPTTPHSWKELLKEAFTHFGEDPTWMNEAIEEVANSDLPEADRQVFLYFPDRNSHPDEQQLLIAFTCSPRTFMPVVDPCNMVIIPPRLFSALLKARFKENAMTPCPVLGYSPKEKLSDPSKRVMSIQHRELAIIEASIHGHDHAHDSPLFYFHDTYHLIIESANRHRHIFVNIFLYLKSLSKQDVTLENSKCFKYYQMQALDRDFSYLVADWVKGISRSFSSALTLFFLAYTQKAQREGTFLAEKKDISRVNQLIRDYVADNHFS